MAKYKLEMNSGGHKHLVEGETLAEVVAVIMSSIVDNGTETDIMEIYRSIRTLDRVSDVLEDAYNFDENDIPRLKGSS